MRSSPGAADAASSRDAGVLWLSTDDVPEMHRLAYWHHVVGEVIGAFELRHLKDEDFRGSFGLSRVGPLKIAQFRGVGQALDRTPDLMKTGDADDFIVVLESNNTFQFEQRGRQRSGRGGMVLIDIAQPFQSTHPENLDVVDFIIPRQMMERALGPARHAAGLSIDAGQASYHVVAAFLRSLQVHGPSLDPVSASRMASIAVELIASCFADKIGQMPTRHASSDAILCRAQAFIADHLGVSGLGMQDVAATLNVSVRRLHQVAAENGLSLVDWMWERRLLQARAMLVDPKLAPQSVSAIAYRCGFVDQAHFSRRFKLRFGLAPSDLRAATLAAGLVAADRVT